MSSAPVRAPRSVVAHRQCRSSAGQASRCVAPCVPHAGRGPAERGTLMKTRRALLVAGAGLSLALSGTTPAGAAVGTSAGDVDATRANVISLDALSITDGSATLSFTYSCTGAK